MGQDRPSKTAHAAENGDSAKVARGPGRRLHGAIAHKLGTAILSGQYAPGDVLSGEVAFAEELDVSRSAYREAIQVLTAKGLVESRPKAGTRVLPRTRWNLLDPDVLAWAFAGEPDIQFVRDLFELRAIVARQPLPGYVLTLEHALGRDRLNFAPIPVDPLDAAMRRVGLKPVENWP